MATSTSVTTTYAGEAAGVYIGASLLEGNTLAQNAITIKQNIKYKQVVKTLAMSGLIANQTCDFTDTGVVTIAERIIEPKYLQVNAELCKVDFQDDWDAIKMGYSAHEVLPKNLQDFIIGRMAARIAAANETSIWSGAVGAGDYDGFTALMGAATIPGTQRITGTTVTASNVITELGKVVDEIPASLYGNPDLYIYAPQNVTRAYIRALGGFGASGLGGNGVDAKGTTWFNGGDLAFDGVKIFTANGLASNKMIATTKDNLWFGTGLMNDTNQVKVLDMADKDGSENVRFIMRYTAGVQYGNIADIVTYGIAAD